MTGGKSSRSRTSIRLVSTRPAVRNAQGWNMVVPGTRIRYGATNDNETEQRYTRDRTTVAAAKARVTGGVEATYWTGEDRMVIMAPAIVNQTGSEGTSSYV